jgi:PAS domain S-box-containing protein
LDLEGRHLSDRERTVLLLAADGLTDKEIAKHLILSQRTIGTYWERMRDKLGHYSRTQLVARFVRYDNEVNGRDGYRSLFASWEEGVWIVSPTGKTLYANHRIAELFELTADQLEQIDARVLLERSTSTSLEQIFQATDDKRTKIEFRIEKEGLPAIWIGMQASRVGNGKAPNTAIILRLTDVTIQKRVRHTLDSCESSLTFLSEHCSDLVARFDSKLICTTVNRCFVSTLPGLDIVGRNIRELPHIFKPVDLWAAEIETALQTGEPQSFRGQISEFPSDLPTHLLPVPSEAEKPTYVLSITNCLG